MALARRWLLSTLELAFAHTFAVPASLLAAAFAALLAGPIPPRRPPPRPTTRRLTAVWAAIAGQRMMGRKPVLTTLQQTLPRPAVGRCLPPRTMAVILKTAQGSHLLPKVMSRREATDFLPGCFFESLASWRLSSIQLNCARPLLKPSLSGRLNTWPPLRRDPLARGLAPWPREDGPQLSRH